MKNIEFWKPSKFIISGNKLVPSKNMGLSSKRMASYIADFYTTYIPKYCTGSLLDLGCGNVPLYSYYKNFVTQVTCVDWGFTQHNKLHLDLECDLNQEIPLGDNLFDTIIVSDVVEHLLDPVLLLQEIRRMLAPGGIVLINYPFMYGLHETPYDYCRYTHFYIELMSAKIGLKILEQNEFGNEVDVIENLMLKKLKRKRGGKMLERICSSFFSLINKGCVTAISAGNYSSNPFGYGFVLRKEINKIV